MEAEINSEGFAEMPPDGSVCFECKELITSKMFQMFVFGPFSYEPIETKFKFCKDCYERGFSEDR